MRYKIISILVLLLFNQSSFADFYSGISLGGSNTDQAGYNSPASAKIYFGYKKNQNLGFESAIIDLGSFSVASTNGLTQRETIGLEMSVVGFYPMSNDFSLFGKAGFLSWDVETVFQGQTLTSDTGFNGTVGIGFEYSISDIVAIRTEYQYFNKVSDNDISTFSVGGMLLFD